MKYELLTKQCFVFDLVQFVSSTESFSEQALMLFKLSLSQWMMTWKGIRLNMG